jgi:hypothetical protein
MGGVGERPRTHQLGWQLIMCHESNMSTHVLWGSRQTGNRLREPLRSLREACQFGREPRVRGQGLLGGFKGYGLTSLGASPPHNGSALARQGTPQTQETALVTATRPMYRRVADRVE